MRALVAELGWTARRAVRSLAFCLLAGVVLLTAFGFATAGLFLILAEELHSAAYGALAMAGIYVFVLALAALLRSWPRRAPPMPVAPPVAPRPPLAEAFLSGFENGRDFRRGFTSGR